MASDSEAGDGRERQLRASCILIIVIIDEDFLEMAGINVPGVSRSNRSRRMKRH